MDDFGGTFFDLAASAHNSALPNISSSSSLCGASGSNFFLQEQSSDLETMLLSDNNLSLDHNLFGNSVSSNILKPVKSEPLFSNGAFHPQGFDANTKQTLFSNSSFTASETQPIHNSLEYMLEDSSASFLSKPIKTEPTEVFQSTKVKLVSVGGFTGPADIMSKVSIIRPGHAVQKLSGQSNITLKTPSVLPEGMHGTVLPTCPKVTQSVFQSVVKVEKMDNCETFVKEEPKIKHDLQDGSRLHISVCNVVSSFRVRCHLNLRQIALESIDVVYRRETQKVVMRMRNPKCTAYIWSSGKIVCTGSTSSDNAKKSAKKFARRLSKIGFRVKFADFRVVNVLAVCKMPYAIDINQFSRANRGRHCSYEPELHPGVTFRDTTTKATLKIFSTGSVTVTARSVEKAKAGIRNIYPMFQDFYKYEKPNLEFDVTDALPSDNEDCS